MPNPWDAIESSKYLLKNGQKIGTFSPCIEQVKKTREEIAKGGFVDVETLKLIDLQFSAGNLHKKLNTMTRIFDDEPAHSGYLTFATRFI